MESNQGKSPGNKIKSNKTHLLRGNLMGIILVFPVLFLVILLLCALPLWVLPGLVGLFTLAVAIGVIKQNFHKIKHLYTTSSSKDE
jgi:ABC-type microcin C transport system permease subunit YejE